MSDNQSPVLENQDILTPELGLVRERNQDSISEEMQSQDDRDKYFTKPSGEILSTRR